MSYRAYYYSFEKTGNEYIDAILAAVAAAGKACHHTKYWNDVSEESNVSYVDIIQKAADEAATAADSPWSAAIHAACKAVELSEHNHDDSGLSAHYNALTAVERLRL